MQILAIKYSGKYPIPENKKREKWRKNIFCAYKLNICFDLGSILFWMAKNKEYKKEHEKPI